MSVDRFVDGVTAVQNTVPRHYRSGDEIKMKAEFEDGCGIVDRLM